MASEPTSRLDGRLVHRGTAGWIVEAPHPPTLHACVHVLMELRVPRRFGRRGPPGTAEPLCITHAQRRGESCAYERPGLLGALRTPPRSVYFEARRFVSCESTLWQGVRSERNAGSLRAGGVGLAALFLRAELGRCRGFRRLQGRRSQAQARVVYEPPQRSCTWVLLF
jgi:hypothetical protein